jgi:hypothetical protein
MTLFAGTGTGWQRVWMPLQLRRVIKLYEKLTRCGSLTTSG